MQSGIGPLFGIVIVGIVTGIVWRFASNRRQLPCPSWLHWCVELDNPFTQTSRAAFIVEHLGLQPGMTVLDAGVGEGRLPAGYFDRALLVTVLGAIVDASAALHEIFNAFKPAGVWSVTEVIFAPHFQSVGTVSALQARRDF